MDLNEVQGDIVNSPWTATLLVNEKPVTFKLDSGADVTVVPYDSLLKLDGQTKLQPTCTDKVLLGPCKYKLNCKGKFTATLTNKSKSMKERIYVAEDLTQPLLGRAAAESLNLINRIHELTSDEYKANVIHDYPKPLKKSSQS